MPCSTAPFAASSDRPRFCIDVSILLKAGVKPDVMSASRLWCSASRRSQKVVTSDTENPAAMMRAKFDRLAAAGIFDCGTPSSRMEMGAVKEKPDEEPF